MVTMQRTVGTGQRAVDSGQLTWGLCAPRFPSDSCVYIYIYKERNVGTRKPGHDGQNRTIYIYKYIYVHIYQKRIGRTVLAEEDSQNGTLGTGQAE
jgi:hypothetical protein